MSLTTTDLAGLIALAPGRMLATDHNARALAIAERDAMKAEADEAASMRALAYADYTPAQLAARDLIRSVYWPRARALSNELTKVRGIIKAHFARSRHDRITLSQADLYDAIRREWRLSVLDGLLSAASARVGSFPLSRNDRRVDQGSTFVKAARNRHFTFTGGRDWGSAEYDPSDIVQGAFLRAIESGDCVQTGERVTVNGKRVLANVPIWGNMYRHVQHERATLTTQNNLEYAARKRVALGQASAIAEEWPDMTDPKNARLLGTRRYASLDQHRDSVAMARRDEELANVDDAVTAAGRRESLNSVSHDRFYIRVAAVLESGATLEEIANGIGKSVDWLTSAVIKDRDEHLIPLESGVDHGMRSIDIIRADEREREIDAEQAAHAARLVAIHEARLERESL